MDDVFVWPFDANDDFLMRNPKPIPNVPMFEERDWQAEFDAIRAMPVQYGAGYDGETQHGIALALCDKGYRWATARSMAARLGGRIPPGSEGAVAAWITDKVPEVW